MVTFVRIANRVYFLTLSHKPAQAGGIIVVRISNEVHILALLRQPVVGYFHTYRE